MHGKGFPSGTHSGTGWAGKASALYMARLYVTLHEVPAGGGEGTLEAMPVARLRRALHMLGNLKVQA